ncbi:hypothetical protein [Streptomyces abyssalis]|uniref:hypothetical protein n=1 Tax=Streptomyces abyssalis TaxID=933944 RepID=UPI000A6C2BA3
MAGHIQDRWYKVERAADGSSTKAKTSRHGNGMRYRARYVGPHGTEKSKSFPDRQKRRAEEWLAEIEADMLWGQYVDPKAGRVTFQQYAERWLAGLTTDIATRILVERHLRRHALPRLGTRPLGSFRPVHIRDVRARSGELPDLRWLRAQRCADVRAVLSAAVDGTWPGIRAARGSVRPPAAAVRRVVPWRTTDVRAVREAFPPTIRPSLTWAVAAGFAREKSRDSPCPR